MLRYLYLQKQTKNQDASVLAKLKTWIRRLLRGISNTPACSQLPAPCASSSDVVLQLPGEEWSPQNCFSCRTAMSQLVSRLCNQQPNGLATQGVFWGGRKDHTSPKRCRERGAKAKPSSSAPTDQAPHTARKKMPSRISICYNQLQQRGTWFLILPCPFNKHPKEDIFQITKEFFTVLTYQAEHNNQLFCLHYKAVQCNELIIYHGITLGNWP